MFGLPLQCIGPTWDKYMQNPDRSPISSLAPKQEIEFLRLLNWMKVYSIEDDLAVKWSCAKETFRRSCIKSVQFLGVVMDEIHWEDRLTGHIPSRYSFFSDARVNFDGTRCPIQRPLYEPYQTYYYSGKEGEHCILYEVGSKVCDNTIVWCPSWLALPGSEVDLNMARRSQIMDRLEPWEVLIVDKGYYGLDEFDPGSLMMPIKGKRHHQLTLDEKTWNAAINSVRVRAEHTNNGIKTYDILRVAFRHDLSLHPFVFHTCANLFNISQQAFPISTHDNPWTL